MDPASTPTYYQRRKARRDNPAMIEDVTKLDRNLLRRHLEQLICPWCNGAPFNNLGAHTVKSHGVSARDLKAHAMVPLDTPLVSTETADRLREFCNPVGRLEVGRRNAGSEENVRATREQAQRPTALQKLQRRRQAELLKAAQEYVRRQQQQDV